MDAEIDELLDMAKASLENACTEIKRSDEIIQDVLMHLACLKEELLMLKED